MCAGANRNQLDAAGSLARIVVDECHLILLAAHYRRRMLKVRELRSR